MARERMKTAAEFIEELADNPVYQAGLRTNEARAAALTETVRRDELELVSALRASGEDIESVWDYVSRGPFHSAIEPSASATAVLVAHLEVTHHSRVREGVIRALSRRSAVALARERLEWHFRAARSADERWLLANALAAMVSFATVADMPEMSQFRGLFAD